MVHTAPTYINNIISNIINSTIIINTSILDSITDSSTEMTGRCPIKHIKHSPSLSAGQALVFLSGKELDKLPDNSLW